MSNKLRFDETTGKYTVLPASISDNTAECPFCGQPAPEVGLDVYECKKCREPFCREEEND